MVISNFHITNASSHISLSHSIYHISYIIYHISYITHISLCHLCTCLSCYCISQNRNQALQFERVGIQMCLPWGSELKPVCTPNGFPNRFRIPTSRKRGFCLAAWGGMRRDAAGRRQRRGPPRALQFPRLPKHGECLPHAQHTGGVRRI